MGRWISTTCAKWVFCLKAILKTDVKIPNIKVSKIVSFIGRNDLIMINKLIVFLGLWRDTLSYLEKIKMKKYSGSYEQISKVIYSVSTQKLEDMKIFYKLIIMNYLLKNGDAHLKILEILYNSDFS